MTDETPGAWARKMKDDELLTRMVVHASAALPKAVAEEVARRFHSFVARVDLDRIERNAITIRTDLLSLGRLASSVARESRDDPSLVENLNALEAETSKMAKMLAERLARHHDERGSMTTNLARWRCERCAMTVLRHPNIGPPPPGSSPMSGCEHVTNTDLWTPESSDTPMTINEIRDNAWRIAREHGFTDNSVEGDIALMHSELSEALEDLRNRAAIGEVWYEEKVPAFYSDGDPILVDGKQATVAIKHKEPYRMTTHVCKACDGRKIIEPKPPSVPGAEGPRDMDSAHARYAQCKACRGTGKEVVLFKPCGIPSEIADVVIRALHFSGKHAIDIEGVIAEKMTYNETRPFKHGGKTI